MSDSVRSHGGAGGESAVTEDLERGARIIESVALLLDDAVSSLGEAEGYADSAARKGSEPTRRAAQRAVEALWDAQRSVNGAGPTALKARELSEDLRRTAEYFIESEQRAMSHVSRLTRVKLAGNSMRETGWWVARHTWAASIFLVGKMGPLGAIGVTDKLAGAVRPDALPHTTGFINRDTMQLALAALDRTGPGYGLEVYSLTAALVTLEGLFGEGHATTVRARADSHGARSPRCLQDVMDGLLVEQSRGDGTVSIETVTHADGTRSHIVTIPGTEDASLNDKNPFDNQANGAGVEGRTSDAQIAIVDAMRAAGIQPGDEVMLAGHSQGGINAVALAARPEFLEEFNVTHIVTAGSPAGRMDLPPSINVLHLEHTEDLVSAFDAVSNPDTPTRTTVQRDLLLSGDPAMEELGRDITGAHHLVAYGSTAGLVDDGKAGASATQWAESASGFFAGESNTLTEYLPVVPPPPLVPEPPDVIQQPVPWIEAPRPVFEKWEPALEVPASKTPTVSGLPER